VTIQSLKVKSQNHSSKVKTDLKERCYGFSLKTIKFIETLPDTRLYWTLTTQLLSSATSIGANIIEAKSASSKRDFTKFFEIALKSANETTYWLGLLRDALRINSAQIDDLVRESGELSRIIAASLLTLKNKR